MMIIIFINQHTVCLKIIYRCSSISPESIDTVKSNFITRISKERISERLLSEVEALVGLDIMPIAGNYKNSNCIIIHSINQSMFHINSS